MHACISSVQACCLQLLNKVVASLLTLRPNGGIQFRAWNDDSSPNCADGGNYELAHRLAERRIVFAVDLR